MESQKTEARSEDVIKKIIYTHEMNKGEEKKHKKVNVDGSAHFFIKEENQEEAQRDHPNGAKEIIEFQFDLIISTG